MSRSPSPQLQTALHADPTSPAPPPTFIKAPSSVPAAETESASPADIVPGLSEGRSETTSTSDSLHDNDDVRVTPAASDVLSVPIAAQASSAPTAPPAEAGPSPSRAQKTTAPADPRVCPTCKSGGRESRNLVVCIDGTSNQFSKKNTNVVELYSRLVRDKTQLTFYNSGIGTYAEPSFKSLDYLKQVAANKLDLMFALRFEKIIISAYRWLVDHYQEGDRIYMFGFSRGAYQVRALAAMLDVVGLLEKGNEDQIPFAYELFAAFEPTAVSDSGEQTGAASSSREPAHIPRSFLGTFRPVKVRAANMCKSFGKGISKTASSIVPPSSRAAAHELLFGPRFPRPKQNISSASNLDRVTLQQHFKDTFSREVKVHFVGAWDTVSSVGFIRGKTLPGTTDGMQNVCFFRHALAMHEYRVKFLPEYSNGGDGPVKEACSGSSPHTKEVWFVGSHSDIGGGSTINTTLDKFGPALRWMSFEADLAGLKFKQGAQKWEGNAIISDSMTWFYGLMEFWPIKRLSYEDKQAVACSPHFFSQRRIQPNQLIHQTVLTDCGVTLEALRLKFKLDLSNTQEVDIYTNAQALLSIPHDLRSRSDWLQLLKTILNSRAGRQSLVDLKEEMIQIWPALQYVAHDSPEVAMELHRLGSILLYGPTAYDMVTLRLSDVLGTSDKDTYRTNPFPLRGHTDPVLSVAFLSPQLVVSGSYDRTLRVWNIETGEAVGDPLTGHTDLIYCVAVSPDGSLVASSSSDGTIRTWRFDAGKPVGGGHVIRADDMRRVGSVAFSPDGLQIVSGSADGALRIWDAATGRQVGNAMEEHDDWVRSVAFSPDGARIASGSDDRTVRLWDARTVQPLGDPLTGHTDYVRSVAFSPDGVSIASGSDDETVRIWNSNTRELMHTLVGHSYTVWSVAFSPSGRHIASASRDNTVRIWDAVSGEAVGVLKGHTNSVYSVAFSPDGTRIASGSGNDTVRIWDRIPVSSTDAT